MSFVDATGKMLPMGDILQKLQNKYGQSIEGNVKAQQALDAAFGGGADVIKKLYGQQDKLNRSITELGRNDGMKRAQEMAERMAEPWERIKATFFAIRVAIGNTLFPILSPLMNRIADVGGQNLPAGWICSRILPAGWVTSPWRAVLRVGWGGGQYRDGGLWLHHDRAGRNCKSAGRGMETPVMDAQPVASVPADDAHRSGCIVDPVKITGAVDGRLPHRACCMEYRVKGRSHCHAGLRCGDHVCRAAMQLLMSPITLIVAGLALLAVGVWYVITHWEELAAAIMDTSAFAWVMSVAEQVGQVFAQVWQSITDGWAVVVDFFAGLSPLATFEGFAQTIGGVFSKLFDVLKNTFASTYNWIVEKLNKIPGVNIDLKTVSPPAAAAVPANAVIPDSAAGSSKLNSPSVLTGNRINAGIPRGGLMSQVKNDSKTAVDNRKTWGDTYINAPNGITPAQLAEWQELNAG